MKAKILESQIDTWDNETEIGSTEEEEVGRKKKPKVFSITKDRKAERYGNLEKNLH